MHGQASQTLFEVLCLNPVHHVNERAYVYIYTYIYICIYLYVYVYIYTHMCMCMYVQREREREICVYRVKPRRRSLKHSLIAPYITKWQCICMYTCTCTCIYKYVCKYICICVCMCMNRQREMCACKVKPHRCPLRRCFQWVSHGPFNEWVMVTLPPGPWLTHWEHFELCVYG